MNVHAQISEYLADLAMHHDSRPTQKLSSSRELQMLIAKLGSLSRIVTQPPGMISISGMCTRYIQDDASVM